LLKQAQIRFETAKFIILACACTMKTKFEPAKIMLAKSSWGKPWMYRQLWCFLWVLVR